MEKRINRKYAPLIGILLLALCAVVCCVLCVLATTEKRYDLRVGDRAGETIYATRTVADDAATNVLRDAARANTPLVYRIDEEKVRAGNTRAETFFVSLGTLRSHADSNGKRLSAAEWGTQLTDSQKATYMAMTDPRLTEVQLCSVLAAEDTEIALLKNIALPKLSTALGAGLGESSLESVRDACVREIKATTGLSESLKSVGEAVLRACMQPTYVEDAEATELARNEAANAVEDIEIQKGEPVVLEGDVLTSAQLAVLEDLGLVRTTPNTGKNVGLVLALCVAFFAFGVYLVERARGVLLDQKQMLLLILLTLLAAGVYLLASKVNPYISISMFAILLCVSLVSTPVALSLSVLLGFVTGTMAGGGGNLLQFESLAVCAGTAAAGVIGTFSLRNTENRGAYIAAGAVGGAVGALLLFGMSLTAGRGLGASFADMGYFLGSAILSALLVVGSLTIWERLFDVATPARLHELLNTNQPLLRQMMTEAPGTYQHCMNVAALSEAAAQRIGADPLLARVGASYHDVGKLRRPLYFAENQKKGENIHDTLPPRESAASIIAHQKDGANLLGKYKFPSAVVRIAGEHHGNSLVTYFYYKAQQSEPGVEQREFRYPGAKPSTAESAIVMLADSCEAAVRSLGESTHEARKEMVHKVIWGKMNDADNNLLSDVPLTLKQLHDIERSFLRTFNGIMHDRIEYPDLEDTRA